MNRVVIQKGQFPVCKYFAKVIQQQKQNKTRNSTLKRTAKKNESPKGYEKNVCKTVIEICELHYTKL